MTVSDYVETFNSSGIRVNRDYQRSGGLWPPRAASALIETMILGYPMPAIFLHQRFDSETRKPVKEVVDGQQRTDAIAGFWNNGFALAKTLPTVHLRGKHFKDLSPEEFEAFATYSLPIFLFTESTEKDVREAFRRINSHTSILNSEEKRHSIYQGPMKWFVVALSDQHHELMKRLGVFTQKQFLRMQDAKIVSELLYILDNGIKTTKAEQLDSLFRKYDSEAEDYAYDDTKVSIMNAMQAVASWTWLPDSSFVKPYQFLCLILAVIHAQKPIQHLVEHGIGGKGLRGLQEISTAMDFMDQAIELPEEELDGDIDDRVGEFRDFARASSAGTNVGDTRITRFVAYLKVVSK